MPLRAGCRIVAVDDGPFAHRAGVRVLLVAVMTRGAGRVDGVMSSRVVKDGFGATSAIESMLLQGRFCHQAQAVLTDGVAVGGFNVIDLPRLAARIEAPVIAVMRRSPRLERVRRAILHTSQPERRWRMVQAAGPIYQAGKLWFQVAGASEAEARRILALASDQGQYPEGLRLAHLIAGGIVSGASRGRP